MMMMMMIFHFIDWSGLLETAGTVWPHHKAGGELYWVFVVVVAAAACVCVCQCCRGSMSQGLARASRGEAADATAAVQSEPSAVMNPN